MDNSLLAAIVTSVCTAGSTAGVAITALVLNNKRFDRIDARLDKIDSGLEILTGLLHELDKRLSIVEDRILNRPT